MNGCVCTRHFLVNTEKLFVYVMANPVVFIVSVIYTYCSASGFWVGKKSLQTWRKLYLQCDGDTKSSSEAQIDSGPSCLSSEECTQLHSKAHYEVCDTFMEPIDASTSNKMSYDVSCQQKWPSFNSDILCEHGELHSLFVY